MANVNLTLSLKDTGIVSDMASLLIRIRGNIGHIDEHGTYWYNEIDDLFLQYGLKIGENNAKT